MKFLLGALKAVVAATLVNGLLYWLGRVTGILVSSVIIPNTRAPLTLKDVLGTTIFAVLIATLIYGLFVRFSRRPKAIFNIVALVLLVLSFATPFTLKNVPLGMIILLETMHVVVAFFTVYFLKTFDDTGSRKSVKKRALS